MFKNYFVFAGVFASVSLAGCGSSDDSGAGDVPSVCQDFDTTQSAAPVAYKEVNSVFTEQTFDADSCSELAPSEETCTFNGQVIDFQEDEWLESGVLGGTTVKIFVDNVIPDINVTCAAAGSDDVNAVCFEATASSTGEVSIPGLTCNKKFAVWAFKENLIAPVTKPAVEFDRVVKPGSTAVQDVLTISITTYNLVPGIVGFNPDPTLGIVAGKAEDCSANNVQNIGVHITDSHVTTAPAEFCGTNPIHRVGTFYFKDNFPSDDEKVTSEDGLFAFANVVVGDVTIFAYSNEGGTKTQVGYTQGVSLPDTITIIDVSVTPPAGG